MSSVSRHLFTAAAAAVLAAASTSAQLLPNVGGPIGDLPTGSIPVVGPIIRDVMGGPGGASGSTSSAISPTLDTLGVGPAVAQLDSASLLDLRRARLLELVRQNRRELDMDGDGAPARRGQLVAINPDPTSLAAAARAGFRIIEDAPSASLGLRMVLLGAPRGMGSREALKRLRAAAPSIDADYDHIFEPAGGTLLPLGASLAAAPDRSSGAWIAMVDGGVASHPSLASAVIEQRGFAGSPKPTGHGTAVASLIVRQPDPFRGAARGASLLVADVYGGSRAAGSASAIVRALDWVASRRPQVANISLVGPPNRAMARAVAALQARGITVVAAVGNDGSAAPPQYPASYPGVVSVTGVDAKGRALPEAGRPGISTSPRLGRIWLRRFPAGGMRASVGQALPRPWSALVWRASARSTDWRARRSRARAASVAASSAAIAESRPRRSAQNNRQTGDEAAGRRRS